MAKEKQKEVWMIKKKDAEFVKKFHEITNDPDVKLTPFTITYLIRNGIDTPEKVKSFVNFTEKDIPDVLLMKDADVFLNELQKAIQQNKNIVIYSDYDMDGVGGAAVMMKGIRSLGGNPKFFINDRFKEGYGINEKGMKRLLETYPETNFIVTVDNGIKATEGIKYAMEHGIEVIVSDHHEPNDDGSIPECLAVVDAKRFDDTYPFKDLCGCGLAYKLLLKLHEMMNIDSTEFQKCLAYVAMSTIADLVSLTEENRLYVKQGLERIKNEELICFKALREQTETKTIDETTIGFTYAPMVNAVGRITGDVSEVVEMLISDDLIEASEYVQEMMKVNKERQGITDKDSAAAMFNVDINQKNENAFIMIWGEFHQGVAGIVASKLVEKYKKPAIVLCKVEDGDQVYYKGSGRSVEGFNMKEALDTMKEDLMHYGGHEMAAGVAIDEDNLIKVENALCRLAQAFEETQPDEKIVYVDFPMRPCDITIDFVYEYEMLKPFGQGLPKPVVGLSGYEANKPFYMGEDGKHLKLSNNSDLSVVWFGGSENYKKMGEPTKIKCIGYPSKNIFRGKVSVQFMVDKGRLLPA